MFTVYCHENNANGKVYVGITSQDPERRWLNGHGYSKNKKFSQDIEKYGWDEFTHRIVADGLTEHQAVAIEKEMIAAYDARNLGYNNHNGGKYVPKRAVCHYGNLIRHTLETNYYKDIPAVSSFLEVLNECEKVGKDDEFTKTVNMFIEAIIQRFQRDNRPLMFSDYHFIIDFLWEWRRILMIHLWVHANGYTERKEWDCDRTFPSYEARLDNRCKRKESNERT